MRFSRSDFVNPAERFTTLVWKYGADVRWQMTPKWAVMAEGFYGNALGSYAAGTKQTFNTVTGQGVAASGGFVELEYRPVPKWVTHAGFLIDDPLDRDVAIDFRTRQQIAYGNVMYSFSRYLSVGFEAARVWAGFKGTNRADNQAWVFHNKIIFTC